MRFALYHPWVYLRSGLERTYVEVIRRSRHDWTWFTSYYRPEDTFPEVAELPVVALRREIAPARSPLRAGPAAAALLATRLPDGYDATLMSLNGLSDLALARARRPVVGLCLTPMKPVFDRQARQAMRARKPIKHAAVSLLAPGYASADRLLWRRLQRVVAISEEVKSRIVNGGLATPERVEVIHPGVDIDRFTPGPADRGTQLLAAGRISWYKNFELAIDTVRDLRDRDQPADLVIAGFLHPSDESYLLSLRERAAGLPVRFVIGPSDAELIELYRRSDLMLFTAVNEDFGIAPIEAMACGTPVVAIDTGGPRETVAHDRSGWLVEDDAHAFAAAVRSWRDRADQAAIRASTRAQAEKFDWSRFVEHIDRTMEAAAGRD